ncbi:uncharacterized protein [Lepisosteus oculatus]|uniref:uncharacterized protein n=1 Tax=Lepisosteus oculatus TaxID=7918 RepID=UPI0035F51D85
MHQMPFSHGKAMKERAPSFWKTAQPWSLRVKAALCSHLRFMWMALMALTVLCVAIQILGMTRRYRSDKISKQFTDDKLFRMRFTFELQKTITTTQEVSEEASPGRNRSMKYIQGLSRDTTLKNERHGHGHGNPSSLKADDVVHTAKDSLPPVISHDSRGPRESVLSMENLSLSHRDNLPANKNTKITVVENPKQSNKAVATARAQSMDETLHSVTLEQPVRGYPKSPNYTGLAGNTLAHNPRSLDDIFKQNTTVGLGITYSTKQYQKGSLQDQKKLLQSTSNSTINTKQHLKAYRQQKKKISKPKSSTSSVPSPLNPNLLPHAHSSLGRPSAKRAQNEEKDTCQPKTHIVFLKTHKTASSTILNILYRFGESRNLTFALPLSKHSQLFYPLYFTSLFVEGFKSRTVKEYDIMCNHMRFLSSEVKKVMPADSFYFSIVRNPVTMMESIFSYYKSIPAFLRKRNLDEFLENPWKHYNASLNNNHYAKNLLTFDFGFNNNANDNERYTNLSITMIENTFDLILVSEYFDESMILLKNALCWKLDDVVSFKLNSRSNKTRQDLSRRAMEKIKQWNSLDWKLYLHFNATFWKKIDETVGREEMEREVERLRERRVQLMKTCLQDEGAVDPSQIKDTSLKPFQYGAAVIQGYNLNPELDEITKSKCQSLIMPELQYTALLYTKQFPDIAAKLSASSHQLSPGKSRTHHSRNWEARKAIAHMRNVKNQVYKGHQRSFSNWTTASSLQNVP